MFTANHTARSILAGIATTDLPAILSAVATERSITVAPPRKVYEEVLDITTRSDVLFPNVEIRQPEGRVVVQGGQAGSECEVWVLASVSSGSPAELDRLASAYLTALGRAFTYGQGRSPCPYEYELTGFSTSPPFATVDAVQVQTVGVSVLVSLIDEAV